MTKMFNEKSAFDQVNETYIGTWFGHDIWLYDSHGKPNLLAVHGNEPGDYATWIGDSSWFNDDSTIGVHKSEGVVESRPMQEHLTTNDLDKAFLMGFAAIYNRNGGDLSGYAPAKEPMSLGVAEIKINELRNAILFDSVDPSNDEASAYFCLAMESLAQAEQFMKLCNLQN